MSLAWAKAAICTALLLAAPLAAAPATDALGLATMTQAIERGEFRRIEAVVVQRGRQIVYEGYFGTSGPESRINARSTGKSVTALAVGIAADRKLLAADTLVMPFFADRAPLAHDGPAKQAIRVDDLLGMSSALACNDWLDASPGNEERMYDTRDWTRFALDIPVDPDYARDAAGHGRFAYCTAGAFLLGQLVERASGQRFDRFVEANLFAPLGITGAVWKFSPSGEVMSGGGLQLRARDWIKLGQLVLDRGQAGGRQIVSVEWLRAMLQPYSKASPVDAYGWLWWIRDFRALPDPAPHVALYMSGNGGNKVVVFPRLDTVVVLLSTNYNTKGQHQQTAALIEEHILPALLRPSGAAAAPR